MQGVSTLLHTTRYVSDPVIFVMCADAGNIFGPRVYQKGSLVIALVCVSVCVCVRL